MHPASNINFYYCSIADRDIIDINFIELVLNSEMDPHGVLAFTSTTRGQIKKIEKRTVVRVDLTSPPSVVAESKQSQPKAPWLSERGS